MPTILQALVEELGTKLDEKAHKALLEGTSPVCALSIIHKLENQKEEVRNPSAFVEKAVRTAAAKGPSAVGQQELDNALARLQQCGNLDDNALDALRKGSVLDACGAISALLSQDAGSVRNASAYVTRNMANARKGASNNPAVNQVPMVPMGGGMVGYPVMGGPPGWGPPPPGDYMQGYGMRGGFGGCRGPPDFLMRWQGTLDQKAMDALISSGPHSASEIIQDLEAKGNSVRNPSAYVQKACETRLKDGGGGRGGGGGGGGGGMDGGWGRGGGGMDGGGMGGGGMGGGGMMMMGPPGCGGFGGCGGYGPPMPMPMQMPMMGFGGPPNPHVLLAKFRHVLDQDAIDALHKLGPMEACHILSNLESKSGTIRNPSAYVVRSAANIAEGQGLLGGNGSASPTHSGGGGCQRGFSPPAYHGGGGGRGGGSFSGWGDTRALDEKAIEALKGVSPEVADTILSELETKSHTINNPSAYVCRAIANAKRGEGPLAALAERSAAPASRTTSHSGRAATGDGPVDVMELLDDRARGALDELSTEAAATILQHLEEMGDRVQNPSAYVLKAVGNTRRGKGQAAESAQAVLRHPEAGEDDQVAELLAPWRSRLDAEAQKAVESLSLQAVQHIMAELENKGSTIRNHSAYVARAVANWKSGQGPLNKDRDRERDRDGPTAPSSGASRWEKQSPDQAQLEQELRQEMDRLGSPLDEKALDALEEVGTRSALTILKALTSQPGKVNNPNAYIMRAVGNEKRGTPGGMGGSGPPAKRSRT